METQTTTKRRSRMRRQQTAKRIELTPRDIKILLLLNRYRYLRSSHVHQLVGGKSKRRFIERLGHLYHEGGYVNRPAAQWQAVNARYMPAVYELGEAGEQVLAARGLAQIDSPLLHRGRGNGFLFHHELMVSDILSSIEIGIRARRDLRFISWQEILTRAPDAARHSGTPFELPVSIAHQFSSRREICDKPVNPDAVFGIEYAVEGQKSYRFFALEADRSSEPVCRSNLQQSSYLRKILQYREIIRRQTYTAHLGLPNLFVLTVTTDARHLANILSLVNELSQGKGNTFLLFKTMPSLASLETAPPPSPFILTAPWQRAGFPDLCIGQP